ncbi:MAG TPA: LacI family DNA-binding transcriptional regulator [Spirochaetales bacterium]|nr:LacI family DNA-binding transcriptional regulator [Spirochaetales bacterium]
MMKKKKKVTIKDIAEYAQVSKATVSFAFNMPWKITPETREKVMRAADVLGYAPDPVARTLATKRVGAIGLLLLDPIQEAFKNPYMFEVLQGIGKVCNDEDLVLTILPPVKGLLKHTINTAVVDGFITIGISPGPEILSIIDKRHIPFVTIDGAGLSSSVNIGIDDSKAAYDLMNLVLHAGHRSIAVISLKISLDPDDPGEIYRSRIVQNRLAGVEAAWKQFVEETGKHIAVTVYYADANLESSRSVLQAMFNEGIRPDAIVCLSDIAALAAYDVCNHLGYAIPDTISIAGFDGIELSSIMRPSLTTVVQSGYEKGIKAAQAIVAMMKNEPSETVLLNYHLFYGDSIKNIQ